MLGHEYMEDVFVLEIPLSCLHSLQRSFYTRLPSSLKAAWHKKLKKTIKRRRLVYFSQPEHFVVLAGDGCSTGRQVAR